MQTPTYWQQLGDLPTSIAIVCAALLAFVSTLLIMRNNRALARRQETIKMLMQTLWDKDYIEKQMGFLSVVRDEERLEKAIGSLRLARKATEPTAASSGLAEPNKVILADGMNDLHVIRLALNNYEIISIGIREGIYDERIYRRWYQQSFVQDWVRSKHCIDRMRGESKLPDPSKLYSEFEELAKRWQKEGPLRVRERHVRILGGRALIIRDSR